jgi:TMEM175 potassium channel family protein
VGKGRLEAFSDGVIAVAITLMVLDLKVPHGTDFPALASQWPLFMVYVLSYVTVGIYWTNHHHMLHAVERVTGNVLWANLHLLFWITLVPFVTGWMGENHIAAVPVAAYGVVLLMCGVSYAILQAVLLYKHKPDSLLAAAVGRDLKGKLSLLIYVAAIPLAFVKPWIALVLYAAVALMWVVPDARIEKRVRR